AGRRGSRRAMTPGETYAAIAPETATPRTRNGTAWTITATKIVAQLATAGRSNKSASSGRPAIAATRSASTATRPGSARAAGSRASGASVATGRGWTGADTCRP